jgi:hypothetical protein
MCRYVTTNCRLVQLGDTATSGPPLMRARCSRSAS